MNTLKDKIENGLFGVAQWFGEKLHLDVHSIRLFFIYLSFATLGSFTVLYLIFAFFLRNWRLFKLFLLRQLRIE
ncbi:MAG TPA: PspC family transcriptional regulator [Flavobacteriales bacterium]|nr:PspC family transcriptional regulator [Flavobacteriales bacterium]|tara:strand:+ start:13755 stop:13976 length:222 start_codon:yes stop_codon:yes gene_type:complete